MPSPSKPTSAAAARRATRQKAAPPSAVLAAGVAERISSYTPSSIPGAQWALVRPLVMEVVTAAAPSTPERAKQLMLPAAKLTLWAIGQGVEMDRATVFTSTMVEEWARAQLAAGVSKRTVATHRSQLRAILPPSPSSAPKVGRGDGPNPYSATEDLALRRAVVGQRTPVYRANGCLLYGLARGAGLNAAAVRQVRRDDVIDHCDGAIEVRVDGRSLWVLDSHVDVVRIGLSSSGSNGYLVGGRDGNRHNITEYVDRFSVPAGTPHLNIGRCRNTWILDHLRRGTPIKVIVDALGFKTLAQVEALLALVDSPDPDVAAQALRGTS
ncbi:MAG: hypothetical protein KDB26_06600 [Microthrixaceae bacterium]|nr:hypothetical protein [Microthrixaceae bacterium]